MTGKLSVCFRVDASVDIGSGHVMRCLALADALSAESASCEFVCRDLPGHLGQRITDKNYGLALMPLESAYLSPSSDSDYAGWLQVAELVDADDVCGHLVTAPDIIVVDHYALGLAWEASVRGFCGARTIILAIDDLCRNHAADYILDQTPGRTAADYAGSQLADRQIDVFAGSRYALLRQEFAELRKTVDRGTEPVRHRLLVTMGGYDKHNVTGSIVECFYESNRAWIEEITIVLPESAPHYQNVLRRVEECSAQVRLLGYVSNMGDLMTKATICIGAPGSTSWERAALGLPSVLVPMAENQLDAAQILADTGVALLIPADDIESSLWPALQILRENWPVYVARSLDLVDAHGACRVAHRLIAGTGK